MRTALAELEEGELIEKALAGQAECWAESSFRTWITRVAINEAVMLCRRERAKPPFLMLPDGNVLACSGEGVDRSLIRKEVARAVRRAMGGAPVELQTGVDSARSQPIECGKRRSGCTPVFQPQRRGSSGVAPCGLRIRWPSNRAGLGAGSDHE